MKGKARVNSNERPARAARPKLRLVMERHGRLDEMNRSFDIEFWQRLGDAAIFDAAWELVEFHYQDKGRNLDELRLQRSIEHFQRQPG